MAHEPMSKSETEVLRVAEDIGKYSGDASVLPDVKKLLESRANVITAIAQQRSTGEVEEALANGLREMTRQVLVAWKKYWGRRSRIRARLRAQLQQVGEHRKRTVQLFEDLAKSLAEADPARSEELARQAREVRQEPNALEPVYRGLARLGLRASFGPPFGITRELALVVWWRTANWAWRHAELLTWGFALGGVLVGWATANIPALPIPFGKVCTPIFVWYVAKYAFYDRVDRWLEDRRRDRLARRASQQLWSACKNRCALALLTIDDTQGRRSSHEAAQELPAQQADAADRPSAGR